jgi:hypothetical protein
MARSDRGNLVHSVAFRVTEAQWIDLQRCAEKEAATVPQLAKLALFERFGIKAPPRLNSPYGEKQSRKKQMKRP